MRSSSPGTAADSPRLRRLPAERIAGGVALAGIAVALALPSARTPVLAAACLAAFAAALLAWRTAARERGARIIAEAAAEALAERLAESQDGLGQFANDCERLVDELKEEKRHFELALQGSHDGVWEYDLRTKQLYLSPDFRERLSLEPGPSQAPLAWFEEHLHPDDLDRWRQAVSEHLEQRASYSLDVRMRTPAGDYRWFRARGSAEWDVAGRPVRMSGSLTDTTQRRFAEARMRESEASFRSLSAASPVGILKTDAFGLCEYCNVRWQEITGLSDFQAIGEGWVDAVAHEDREGVIALWADFVTGRGEFDARFRAVAPDGTTRWVHSRANPVTDDRDHASGFVLTFEDVTGERHAALALSEALERAMQAAQAKSEFLANMSHEIRTPLNGVIGMAELLTGTPLSDEQHDYVRTINTSADALLSIINDILDFSKIEAGKLAIEKVPLELRAIFDDVAELLAPRARERGLELVVAVEPALPRRMIGDPTRIRQILLNLASNAIKFTDRGEIELGAEWVADASSRRLLKLRVRDTGIGIPPERLGAVFESFTQADGSTTRKYGGTGLGLTISRQLAELMGGSIHVRSEAGEGSEFWIELPLPAAPEEAAPEAVPGLAGARVLVVDGHPVNRRILVGTLRGWGARPEAVASGEEAIARVADEPAEPFDLVLLDYRMPGMDGIETARRLFLAPGSERRGVLMLSSLSLVAGLEADVGPGRPVEAWLTRPLREGSLARALGRAMGRAGHPTPIVAHVEASGELAALAVLLVDDNEVNRKVATRMLQKQGIVASVAVNGRDAVERIAGGHYDIVFMDCQMPEMDGFEATRAVREHEALQGGHVRIVAMTANAMEGDRELCIACGMDDYLAKPIKLEPLVEQLRAALALREDRARRAA